MITQAAANKVHEVVELDWPGINESAAVPEEVTVVRKPRKKAGASLQGAG